MITLYIYTCIYEYFICVFVKLFPFLTDNIALSVSGQFRNCRHRHTLARNSLYRTSYIYTYARIPGKEDSGGIHAHSSTYSGTPIEFPIFRAVYPGDDSEPVQTENWPLHIRPPLTDPGAARGPLQPPPPDNIVSRTAFSQYFSIKSRSLLRVFRPPIPESVPTPPPVSPPIPVGREQIITEFNVYKYIYTRT